MVDTIPTAAPSPRDDADDVGFSDVSHDSNDSIVYRQTRISFKHIVTMKDGDTVKSKKVSTCIPSALLLRNI